MNKDTRRAFVVAAAGAVVRPLRAQKVYDTRNYGVVGDGKALDTGAIQRAIDEAAANGGGQVLLRGGRKYLVGTLVLKSGIDFHLADDAELVASTNPQHYMPEVEAILTANGAHDVKVTGTGNINGRALEFMTGFNKEGEIWQFGAFRLRISLLTGVQGLEVGGISFGQAPFWGLHMLGCEHVLVDGVKVRNHLDVPNCDGIDPDHCRDVEIRNCDIVCGDDGIVIKATRQNAQYGPSENIRVHDCTIETKDSGLKIGTETTSTVRGVRFERCEIKSGCRGLTIQLRDEGNVSDVVFSDIRFTAQYQAAPWWGRGEAISFTALRRTPGARIGAIDGVQVRNVVGRAENSIRINGSPESRIRNVTLDNVAVALDRWTKYAGEIFDNRPTTAHPDLERHKTPGIHVRYADSVTLKDCKVAWTKNPPPAFTHAIEAENTSGLAITRFMGEAAHRDRDPDILIR